MDSWELNKIAGAVLGALLIIFGGSTLIEEMSKAGHDKGHAKAGFTLPVEVASADGGGSAAPAKKAGPDLAAVFTALQTADAGAGENVFKKCKTCHTPNEGGKNGVGPNLWNIVNSELGKTEGFSYSKALREKGGKWDYTALAEFLYAPKNWLRGTKMAFGGVKDTGDLANVLAYLRSLSASPAALPAVPAAGDGEKPKQ